MRNGMRPVHPGEVLREDYLAELGMSAAALADALRMPVGDVEGVLNGERAVTADTALRLARYFGTTPEFWMNMQATYELRTAEIESGKKITAEIRPHEIASKPVPTDRTPVAEPDGVDWARAELGRNLRAARRGAGLTRAELARRLRQSEALVLCTEAGEVSASERYVEAVLEACGLPKDWTPPVDEERAEDIRRERAVRREYGDELFDAITKALCDADPIRLIRDTKNAREYEAEVVTILPRLASCSGPADVQRVVHEEFVRFFDAKLAGAVEGYADVAETIWQLWLRRT